MIFETQAMIFETHAHYDDGAFDDDREELIASLPSKGIGRVVNIGASLSGCRTTMELMDRYPFLYGAIGVHPSDTGELTEDHFKELASWCLHPKCLAVGEIGLDYYWDTPERETQKKWFVRQMELARKLGKPMVIHSRDAAKDTIDLMKEARAEEIGGVVHCYSYSKELAAEFLKMGFFFGVGGVLTFKNGKKLREAVEYIPLENIVIETDSPYLAPEPSRGKRNTSLNLTYVVEALAQMKGKSEEEIKRITWENACRLYRLPL